MVILHLFWTRDNCVVTYFTIEFKLQYLTMHVIKPGSNPIDITDPGWEILIIVQNKNDQEEGNPPRLLGFAATYRFYHYPDSLRLRLGQVCSPLH